MNGDLQRLGVLKFTLSTAQEEEPDQDEDGNRHAQKPQKTTGQHVLLLQLKEQPQAPQPVPECDPSSARAVAPKYGATARMGPFEPFPMLTARVTAAACAGSN